MKKIFYSVLLVCGTCFPLRSLAHEMIFGVNAYSFDYQEDLPSPKKSTEKATVFMAFFDGKIFVPSLGGQSFLKFESEISPSTASQFDGTTQTGVPVQDTNYLTFLRLEGDVYWEAAANTFLYSGLGIRYWNRFLSGGTGYREIYTWGYVPVGVYVQIPLNPDLTLGFDASYGFMFNGEIKVIFSETVSGGDDTVLKLGNRGGYKFQVPVKYQFSKSQFGIWINPWYEYSEIGSSDIQSNQTMGGLIQEPASRTIQYGVATGLNVLF
jgi:hypothetical protein